MHVALGSPPPQCGFAVANFLLLKSSFLIFNSTFSRFLLFSAFHAGENHTMPKTKVFVSFDFDNDKVLKDFIIGQAKLHDSPFEVSDHSLKEAAPERDWEKKARAGIIRAEKF